MSVDTETQSQLGSCPAPVREQGKLGPRLFEVGAVDKAISELLACLEAEKERYDNVTKSWIVSPDFVTRLKAVELILVNAEGMPIKRQEIISRRIASKDEIEDKLAASPAARAAMRAVLDRMDKQKNVTPKKKRGRPRKNPVPDDDDDGIIDLESFDDDDDF